MYEDPKNTEAGIPESITINGIVYKLSETPELKSLISAVAKVEKSKLYTQIDALKKQMDDLKSVELNSPSAPFDENKLIEVLKSSFVTKADMEGTLKTAIENAVKPIIETDAERKANELREYKEKIIKENIATCIPDLVEGNTKEELDSSLKKSIELRAKYPSANTTFVPEGTKVTDPLIQKQAEDVKQTQIPQQQTTPTQSVGTPAETAVPPVPRRQAPDVNAPATPKRMSQEEFAKNRNVLEEQIRAMYGQS